MFVSRYKCLQKNILHVFANICLVEREVKGDKGEDIPARIWARTGSINIEILSLPPGAMLTLSSFGYDLYLEPKYIPDRVRYTLCFDNTLFPLASGERYTVEGTVTIPSDDETKNIEAPFHQLQINIP